MTLLEVMAEHPQLCASGFKFAPTDSERAELAGQTAQFDALLEWLLDLEGGAAVRSNCTAATLQKLARRRTKQPYSLGVVIAALIADGRFKWSRDKGSGDVYVAVESESLRKAKYG